MTPTDDRIRAALRELVRLNKLANRLDETELIRVGGAVCEAPKWRGPDAEAAREEYQRCKPLAWAEAEASLAAQEPAANVDALDELDNYKGLAREFINLRRHMTMQHPDYSN